MYTRQQARLIAQNVRFKHDRHRSGTAKKGALPTDRSSAWSGRKRSVRFKRDLGTIEKHRAEMKKLDVAKARRVVGHDADQVRFGDLMPACILARDVVDRGGREQQIWDAIFQSLAAGFFRRGRRLFLIDDKIKSLRAEKRPEISFVMRSPHFRLPKGIVPLDTPLTDNSLIPRILPQTWATVATWKLLCDLRNIPLPHSWQRAVARHEARRSRPNEHEGGNIHATDEEIRIVFEKAGRDNVTTTSAQMLIEAQGLSCPQDRARKLASAFTKRPRGRPRNS